MNLRDLTICKPLSTSSVASPLFRLKSTDTHVPVCILPSFNTNALGDYESIDLYYTNKSVPTRGSFDFIKCLLRKDVHLDQLESAKRTAARNFANYLDTYDSCMHDASAFVYTNNFTKTIAYHAMFNNITSKIFVNNYAKVSVPLSYRSLYTGILGSSYLFVSKGFGGVLGNDSKIRPLVMLMIDKTYIDYYKGANLLGLPIDVSKFEFWVNCETDSITSMNHTKVTKYLFNIMTNPNKIKVVIKSGISEFFSGVHLPELKTISEQRDWAESIKNGYLNQTYKPEVLLPVKKFEIKKPEIKTVEGQVTFRSKYLNKFIKDSNTPTVYNNYNLID